ncbi:MAG: 2'-5' RNA ligase family protein [Owenweeksia sp.]
MDKRPIIISLSINHEAQTFFDRLREMYFPPERNFLKAHLTLFHALPGEKLADIVNELESVAAETRTFELSAQGWKVMGKGVALVLERSQLRDIHQKLQVKWQKHLTAQDAQGLWPHITIQNKVSPQEAQFTYEKVRDMWPPPVMATGFKLYYYDGGPWEFAGLYPFGN